MLRALPVVPLPFSALVSPGSTLQMPPAPLREWEPLPPEL